VDRPHRTGHRRPRRVDRSFTRNATCGRGPEQINFSFSTTREEVHGETGGSPFASKRMFKNLQVLLKISDVQKSLRSAIISMLAADSLQPVDNDRNLLFHIG